MKTTSTAADLLAEIAAGPGYGIAMPLAEQRFQEWAEGKLIPGLLSLCPEIRTARSRQKAAGRQAARRGRMIVQKVCTRCKKRPATKGTVCEVCNDEAKLAMKASRAKAKTNKATTLSTG